MRLERLSVLMITGIFILQAVSVYKQSYFQQLPKIQQQLQSQRKQAVTTAPKGTAMQVTGMPARGKDSARAVLLEFSDYECPFCIRYATGSGMQVKTKYVDSGLVKYIFVNNPLPIHKDARMLASAAICAGIQGHYWEMHDLLFTETPKSTQELIAAATSIGLQSKTFGECLKGGVEIERRIETDITQAKAFELNGTPAFAVGHTEPGGTVVIDKFIIGAQPFPVFENELNSELAKL